MKIFDKKYFHYWYDIGCTYAHINYFKIILQKINLEMLFLGKLNHI